jgi:hypothetical protein
MKTKLLAVLLLAGSALVRSAARGGWNWRRVAPTRSGSCLCRAGTGSWLRLGGDTGYWARRPYPRAYWVGPRYFGHRYYRGYWRR